MYLFVLGFASECMTQTFFHICLILFNGRNKHCTFDVSDHGIPCPACYNANEEALFINYIFVYLLAVKSYMYTWNLIWCVFGDQTNCMVGIVHNFKQLSKFNLRQLTGFKPYWRAICGCELVWEQLSPLRILLSDDEILLSSSLVNS